MNTSYQSNSIIWYDDPSILRYYGDFECPNCGCSFHYSPRFEVGICQACAIEKLETWLDQTQNPEIILALKKLRFFLFFSETIMN